jgi:hypothetical protein
MSDESDGCMRGLITLGAGVISLLFWIPMRYGDDASPFGDARGTLGTIAALMFFAGSLITPRLGLPARAIGMISMVTLTVVENVS